MERIFTNYVVSYDVSDNKNRTKIYNKLKDYGLTGFQKSVFFGSLLLPEKEAILKFVEPLIANEQGDSIVFIPVHLKALKNMNSLNIKSEVFESGYIKLI